MENSEDMPKKFIWINHSKHTVSSDDLHGSNKHSFSRKLNLSRYINSWVFFDIYIYIFIYIYIYIYICVCVYVLGYYQITLNDSISQRVINSLLTLSPKITAQSFLQCKNLLAIKCCIYQPLRSGRIWHKVNF